MHLFRKKLFSNSNPVIANDIHSFKETMRARTFWEQTKKMGFQQDKQIMQQFNHTNPSNALLTA
jgi:hypothetical protein